MFFIGRLLLIVSLFTITQSVFALAFNITPRIGSTLPTQVVSGQTITALYTVQNNTASFRPNNFVKWLPPNAAQVTSDSTYPDLCGATFNLNARGAAGDSCTLELSVSGEISATDPDPHHHLFVCFPGRQTCAGTQYPLNVSVVEATGLQVVAGSYGRSPDLLIVPLLYRGQGTTWTLATSVEIPANNGNRVTTDEVACLTPNNCVAVGSYTNPSSGLRSLIEINNENDWTIPTSITLPPAASGAASLGSVSCTTSSCAAVGFYIAGTIQPLLLSGSNNTWTGYVPSGSELPVDYVQMASFIPTVSCNSSTCVFAGAYNNGVTAQPFILMRSVNNTWAYPNGTITFPPGMVTGALAAVECNDTICVAVGSWDDGVAVTHPLVLTSAANSNIWSTRTVVEPVGSTSASLVSVTCNASGCVGAGSYLDALSNQLPLIVSGSLTNTWLTETIVPPTVPGIFVTGFLNAVSCSDALCAAVGIYRDTTPTDQLFVLMRPGTGGIWAKPTNFQYPSDYSSATGIGQRNGMQAANCVGTSCVMVGSYIDTSVVQQPILLFGNAASIMRVNQNPTDFLDTGTATGTSTINNTSSLSLLPA